MYPVEPHRPGADVDPEKVKAVQFGPEAVNRCRELIKEDPAELDIERFFAELREFYDRKDLVGAFLLSEVWFQFHRKNLATIVRFARDNRDREDLFPMLQWLKDCLLTDPTTTDDNASQVWTEAARQWVAGYSILDDIVDAI